MKTYKKMEEYSLFTLLAKERIFNKKNGTMYLLVRPNCLTIQSKKNNVLFTNLNTLELSVDISTMKVTSNFVNILFVNAPTGSLIKFKSSLELNSLSDFNSHLSLESKRVATRMSIEAFSRVPEEDLLLMIAELEEANIDRLIDKALINKDEVLFNSIVLMKENKDRPELTA